MTKRYINAEEAKNEIFLRVPLTELQHNSVEFVIDKCAKVGAKPVVHAHWISASWEEDEEDGIENTYSDEFICSNCKEHLYFPDAIEKEDIGFSFCPYCGAQMDEKEGAQNA